MSEGNIITFYSYKGGVGRTLALANIGALLSLWGYKVLCIDWDLEAPGLHLYYKPWTEKVDSQGLTELIQAHADGEKPCWKEFVTKINFPNAKEPLLLMTAGFQDNSYLERMQALDWQALYEEQNLGNFLEDLRQNWKQELDFVLIDSRTGITDIGGICTVQLPDVLVILFTANAQSLYGATDVASRVIDIRNELPFDREKLLVLPIPTRFEARFEYEMAQEWLETFAKELKPFHNHWVHKDVNVLELLNFIKIPYIPYWSFGEKVPVLEEHLKDAESISFAFETLAAMLAHRLTQSDILVKSRDSFVEVVRWGPSRCSIQRTGVNPFEYGKPVSPEYFYGRIKAIADVKNRIGGISSQCINIVGQRRNGRSSLLRYIKARTEDFCQPEQKPLILTLDLTYLKFHKPEGILDGLRREITKLTGTEPWSQHANDDPYEVEDGLQTLRDHGHRLIVMLDQFEAIGRRLELFQDWGEDWRAKASAGLFTLVIASKRPLSEFYETLSLTSPFSNIFSTTILGALEEEAWHNLVLNGFSDLGSQGLSLLPWIDDLAGGLPFYTQMAAALLWQYDNLEEAKAEFIFQATPRFEELWRDLTPKEKQALRHSAGISGLAAPSLAITSTLQLHGLLRLDGRLFSSAFAAFVREQR